MLRLCMIIQPVPAVREANKKGFLMEALPDQPVVSFIEASGAFFLTDSMPLFRADSDS